MFRRLSFAPLYFLNALAKTPKIKQTPRAFIRSFVESNIYAVAKRKPEKFITVNMARAFELGK